MEQACPRPAAPRLWSEAVEVRRRHPPPPQRSHAQRDNGSLTGSVFADGPKASSFEASAHRGKAASLSPSAPATRVACYPWGDPRHVVSLYDSSLIFVPNKTVRVGAGQPATFMVAGESSKSGVLL